MSRGAIIALSHGGGPMPVLGNHPPSAGIVRSLKSRVPQILRLDDPDPEKRPRAIVLVTAHWVSPPSAFPEITSGERPELIYDYYGFPEEAYALKYPAPGQPALAARLAELAAAEGLAPRQRPDRGWDHGVFVPLLLARPQADVPVLQVSVQRGDDARAHFRLGRALAALREAEPGVAIVGSGFASFHNLRALLGGGDGPRGESFMRGHRAWNEAVRDAATTGSLREREDKFAGWRSWPDAFLSHPANAAEHFMPLVVCAGAAGDGVEAKHFVDEFMGLDIWSFYWE